MAARPQEQFRVRIPLTAVIDFTAATKEQAAKIVDSIRLELEVSGARGLGTVELEEGVAVYGPRAEDLKKIEKTS